MNPYEVLGVKQDTPIQECKRKARKLLAMYHPDNNSGNEDKFIAVNKAVEMIEKGTVVFNTTKGNLTHVSLFKFKTV